MTITTIPVGFLEANCYILWDEKTKEAVIIDPGDEPKKIIKNIEDNGIKPVYIVLTHSHPDHIGAFSPLKEHFNISDENCYGAGLQDAAAKGEIELGNETLKFVETPGHTRDGICVVWDKNIFTGDTLFQGTIGRTDLEGGDSAIIQRSINKLAEYPDDFRIFPGHGPESTIGEEKRRNPYMNA